METNGPTPADAPCIGGTEVGKFVVLSRAAGLSNFGPSPAFDEGFAQNVV